MDHAPAKRPADRRPSRIDAPTGAPLALLGKMPETATEARIPAPADGSELADVRLSGHAARRMRERRISATAVERAVAEPFCVAREHRTRCGGLIYRYTVNCVVANRWQWVSVIARFLPTGGLLVITAYTLGADAARGAA